MVGVLGNLLTRARPPDEISAGEGKRARGDQPVAISKQQQAHLDHRQDTGDRREGGDEQRHQDRADGDGARRDGLVLDDLFGDGGQRGLRGLRPGVVATMAAVHDQVVEHHDRIVVGNVDFDAESNGMGPVVHVAHRLLREYRGIGADGGAEVDEIGVIMQRSGIRDPETVHGEGGEPRRTRRVLLRFAPVVTHDDPLPGGQRRRARRKGWCHDGDGTVQIRSATCPFPFPVPGYELPVTHRTASPDEAIALGSKDVHVRRLLVEAVYRKIGAVFEEIDPSSVATVLVRILVQNRTVAWRHMNRRSGVVEVSWESGIALV